MAKAFKFTLNAEQKKLARKWVAALRSREFTQGQSQLKIEAASAKDNKTRYCCLGVLCELAGWDGKQGSDGFPTTKTLQKVGIAGNPYFVPDDFATYLAEKNDEGRKFYYIARIIERALLGRKR